MEKLLTALPVKILGAGIKGLSLAYFLRKQGVASVIYEKSDRPGGWIKTVPHEGFLFEAGPRSIRCHSLTLEMIHDLGLSSEVFLPKTTQRYILLRGRLVSSFHFLPRLIGGLIRDLTLPKCLQEMSVEDYFTRRLGKWCTSTLIDPLASGIFAGDISQLSAQGCFPGMTEKGSILRSLWNQPKTTLVCFKNGMKTLVEALTQGQEILYNQTLHDPDYDCTPPSAYTYSSVVSINLGWKRSLLRHPGFGYLVPHKEKEAILGVVFDSSIAGDEDETRLTVMMGGSRHPDFIDYSDARLLEMALKAVEKHLGIKCPPKAFLVHRARHAIPQPLLGAPVKGLGVNGSILHAYEMGLQK